MRDKWTDKPIDAPSERLPRIQRGCFCDECGERLIADCLRCGAPNCCDTCCRIAHQVFGENQ